MQKYQVEITSVAEADVTSVFEYISQDSPGAAIKWVEEIERQIYSLENFPRRCPIIPEAEEVGQESRHLIYGKDRTIFRIQGSKVIIMRVIHDARLLDLKMFEKWE
ncbi:MAG: type II toxin-antitoxin system RelE/ParE family toxin [bacterium]|nr:type II toxin-antitoxin system RelE/ParE family toxin [bacterium]